MNYPIFHPTLEQGSPEWHILRLKKFTGSEFGRLATTQNKPDILPAGAITYIEEVAMERITDRPAKDDFSNFGMEHGKRYEPIGRQVYEKIYNVVVQQIGFIDLRPGVGYSPDGLVGLDGGLEIKCPSTTKPHFDFLRMKSLKEENSKYYWQVIGGLLCSKREWMDFVSYSPFFPANMRFKKYRIYATDPVIEKDLKFLDMRLMLAESECQKILEELQMPLIG
jgi:hypothetical protein